MAKDPVCGMDVDETVARRTVACCAPARKKQFVADPSAYLGA